MSDPMLSHMDRQDLEKAYKKSQDLVVQLNENCRQYRLKIGLLEKKVDAAELKAQHFDIMMDAVRENETVKSSWDRFMMTLRITGYDGTR